MLNQEIFYKELELIESIPIIKRICEPSGSIYYSVFKEKFIKLLNGLNKHKLDEFEVKTFVAITYLTNGKLLNSQKTLFTIPNNISNYEEFKMALIYYGFKNDIIEPNLSNIFQQTLNIEFYNNYESISSLLNLLNNKDKVKFKPIISKYIGKYEELLLARLYPDHKLDLCKINLLYDNGDLEEYGKLVPSLQTETLIIFRNIVSASYDIISYNKVFTNALILLFKLTKSTTPLEECDYVVLAILLDHHSLKEYSIFIRYFETDDDVIEEFRKLCKAYVKLISSRSKVVIKNRLDKVMQCSHSDRVFKDNHFGGILKEEFINFEGSKIIDKVLVEIGL